MEGKVSEWRARLVSGGGGVGPSSRVEVEVEGKLASGGPRVSEQR